MGRTRLDDLKKAKEVLIALGFNNSSKLIKEMENKVNSREVITWSEMQTFLDTLEEEVKENDSTCNQTFEIMEKIILQALEDSNRKNRKEFRDRALNAPPIDPHIELLNSGLSTIHIEIHKTGQNKTGVLLMMLGHMVRWQVLEDFAKEWVGHWGKGLNDRLKNTAFESLLILKYGKKVSHQQFEADSRLYRDAIGHGGFKFENEHKISFWTRDSRGRKHDLPSLSSGDIFEIYNRTEKRLRMMEIIGRVFRAWGRHSEEI